MNLPKGGRVVAELNDDGSRELERDTDVIFEAPPVPPIRATRASLRLSPFAIRSYSADGTSHQSSSTSRNDGEGKSRQQPKKLVPGWSNFGEQDVGNHRDSAADRFSRVLS
jgi:hypothetical protein